MDKRKSSGVTMLELLVVVAIVGIIAAIMVPSYRDNIRQARRADGMDALLNIQNLQERYRANNATYGTLAQIGADSDSNEGFYTIAVTGNTAIAYVTTATGEDDQANDSEGGTACGTLTITVNAANPRGLKTPADCW